MRRDELWADIKRRVWLEITGQGFMGRIYLREVYGQRWWETRARARRRTVDAIRKAGLMDD